MPEPQEQNERTPVMLCVECDMALTDLWWFVYQEDEEPMPYECMGTCDSCGDETFGYDQKVFDEVVS